MAGFKRGKWIDADELKNIVGISQVLLNAGIEVVNGQCLCPFHDDNNPSGRIYGHDMYYCHGCHIALDIFGVIQRLRGLSFSTAVQWIHQNIDTLTKQPYWVGSSSSGYKGPVSPNLIAYWHLCLPDERRQQLHQERLINDDTIDQYRIGWRPDWNAYTLPFWSDRPGNSEVEIVQFRRTKDSPAFFTSKYMGLSGHNRPCWFNKHLIGSWVFVVFGTFDALLAGQDGFPAVSPNGAGAFAHERHADLIKTRFGSIYDVVALMDSTPSEHGSALKTLNHMPNARIVTLPEGPWTDYSDYRQYHSASDVMKLIWMLS